MKHSFIALSLTAVVLASCSKNSDNQPAPPTGGDTTSISGDVSGTWTKGNVYNVTGSIQIAEGKSLTIEEGVTVLFSDSIVKPEVIVKGNLYAMGTAQSPVKFTVPDNFKTDKNAFGGLWGGIIAGPNSAELVLQYAVLEYGGAVTTEESASVKAGLYKGEAGEPVPVVYTSNVNGKFIMVNSTVRNFHEDGIYLEGGQLLIANNLFHTTGLANGDAVNIKSGCVADVAFNLIYSPNTNGMKLSNSDERTPQADVIGYNNTIVNAGWRRPTPKGGSIWVEEGVKVTLYNNMLANDRFGIKRDVEVPEDNRSVFGNTFYYGFLQEGVNQFQPGTDIIAGTGDIRGTTAGANDPKFVNYPVSTDKLNSTFDNSWDFHLQAGSPALGKGKTDFTPHFSATGLTANGVTFKSPVPANYIGAFGTK
ncbi:right-handed parallel beta-helix repeat-containing protein [Chitinophaga agrisoli]|uniref:Right-handed parallel beta-helix repeat-containing protein n=1 Tax=Chitinophaga agrisoli TaxID=2607653 RepID=A0A5B2VK95_9BACT|nr:right-handed parallel beta-helix repeat-containing protein [Chitinophaga agrisoli]KAA2238669.1 right-handed parallel beta-helix repeat-containing protein [Chitinophaga agrisoli]